MARKILLADDSVTAQNMGRRILTDAGYEVITVNNGSAALKKIAESKPDLIVLDVYMPGYGGLEVCQRIREAPETARIPVLLTVGKLEPFKADEARRVRADAYIVKPFEASELLTALTKLEDKIVPQAKPYQPGRFAKAIAAVEESGGADFGDSETGWKNRLKIPPPHSKSHESGPEEPPVPEAGNPALSHGHKSSAEASPGIEQALLSALPPDVTSEEIAAIRAAAAAFSAQHEESGAREGSGNDQLPTGLGAVVSRAEPKTAEPATGSEIGTEAAFASTLELKAQIIESKPELQSAAPTEKARESEDAISKDVPAEPEPMLAPVASGSADSAAPERATAQAGNLGDEEVAAALASLAPTNGQGAAIGGSETESVAWSTAARELVPATMAAATAGQEFGPFSGSRWIAQEIPITEDESTLILEEEMHKAYAAMAAADAGRVSFAAPSSETVASVMAAESLPSSNEEAESSGAGFSAGFSTPAFADAGDSTPVEVGATAASESAEIRPSEMSGSPAVDAISEFDVSEAAVSEGVVSEVKEEAAFAAAASASFSSPQPVVSWEATSEAAPDRVSESTAKVSEEGEDRRESQLAAAWANWKQIRDSVVGAQASPVAEGAAAELSEAQVTEVRREEPAATEPEPQPEVSTSPADEASAISSIVDNMLAELKPRLMEEIAKKMGKERK